MITNSMKNCSHNYEINSRKKLAATETHLHQVPYSKGPFIIYGGGWHRREKGWVN